MSALESLKVTTAPLALAPTAQSHNALVALIESMVGDNGVKVTVSEGRILIELSGTKGPGNSNSGSSGGGGGTPFNNELHYDDGTIQIDIDGDGISVTASGNTFTIDDDGILQWTNGTNSVVIEGDDIQITGTSGALTIGFSDITRSMGIKTISVCDSGTAKSMDIIASDPY